MIKILHSADFHLDSPFASLTEEKASQRREEQRQLLPRILNLARMEAVSLILLSGDLFDSGNAYYETTESLIAAFSATDIPIFISPGNHDYYDAASPYTSRRWPKNVHIFKSPNISRVLLPELGCVVYGAGFSSPVCTQPILSGFSAADSGLIRLMVLHGEIGAPSSRYNPISENEIAASGLDYLALGHTHAYSGILKAGETHYAYPGCPEGRGFDETGEKGVIIGEIGRGVQKLSFTALEGRRYRIITLSDDFSPPSDGLNDICKIILTGQREGELKLDRLYQQWKDSFYHLVLEDRTRVKRDLWEQGSEDTLRGLFIKDIRRLYDEAKDDENREKFTLALRYGLAALERGEEPCI